MIVTVHLEADDEGVVKEYDFFLDSIARIDWAKTSDGRVGCTVTYTGGGGTKLRPEVAKKLYPKVRAWQRTLETMPHYAPEYREGGEL